MTIFLITENENKVREVQRILPDVQPIALELDEIQGLDPLRIIAAKLRQATEQRDGEFFVEDSSLYLDCQNGFPGPLIKWLLQAVGHTGIVELVQKYGSSHATVKTVIGYSDRKDIHFFVGELHGQIVPARGKEGFGWDPIFQPDGFQKTIGEMAPVLGCGAMIRMTTQGYVLAAQSVGDEAEECAVREYPPYE